MKCAKCQYENPEGLKFCVECGNKSEITCSNCGFGNPPSFKFCDECGQNITLLSEPTPKDLSFDEKMGKIPSSIIILLTNYDLPEYRVAAYESGANYFIGKGSSTAEEILQLVDSVLHPAASALVGEG